jgi:transketolase
MRGDLPADWPDRVSAYCSTSWAGQTGAVATRKASQNVIEALAPALPELLGGSADLTGSNLTNWSGTGPPIAMPAATMCTMACVSSA